MIAVACLALAAFAGVVLSLFDLRRRILPNALVLVVAGSAVGFHAATGWAFVAPVDALFGMLVPAGLLLLTGVIYRRLRGVRAIGFGDVKLVAASGLWLGWQAMPAMLALAGLLVLAVVPVLARRRPSHPVLMMRVPFGPALCASLATCVIWQLSA